MQMRMPQAEKWLVAGCTALTVGLFAAALLASDRAAQVFFDNASWTLAFSLSAFLAWRGRVQASVMDHSLHNGLLLGALLILAGQLMWNVQVATVLRRFVWNLTTRIHRSGARWGLWATRQSELSTNPRGGVLCQGGLQDGCGH